MSLPILDESGQVSVGVRLQRTSMTYNYKQPIPIPKETHLAQLLIRHYQEKRSLRKTVHIISCWRSRFLDCEWYRVSEKRNLHCCVYCAKIKRPLGEKQKGMFRREKLEQPPPPPQM